MTENAGLIRKVWLHLLRHGGRWKGKDLASECLADTSAMHDALRMMVGSDYLRRWEKSDTQKVHTYGVTSDCKIPRGVTVQDMIECDLVPFVESGK